ncbi:MAG: VanW family protein, partial [Coriobacteriia bacterium]|nr:VanW family protein [Coriobacteriia bacterium]
MTNDHMTDSKETTFLMRYFPQGTLIVAPLLILCSLVMSGYMFLGNLMPPDSSQQQIAIEYHQSNQSSGQSNEGGASSGVGTELDDVVVIAQNTAVSTSTDTGRVENLRLATQAIDGIVIEPGETFSFNEVVGDVENDSRYRPAPMVLDSETDYIRGGGVSQVSSALYVAALSTNLVIEERHPHPTNVDFAQT